MRARILLVLIAILIWASSAAAFDGKRKGFVLGGGVGWAPVMDFKFANDQKEVNLSANGIGFHGYVGLGLSDRDVLVLQEMLSVSTEYFDEEAGRGPGHGMKVGLTLYHYFSPKSRSLFVAGGIGQYYQNIEEVEHGIGFLVGTGADLHKYFQIGLYYIWGWVDGPYDITVTGQTMIFMLSFGLM